MKLKIEEANEKLSISEMEVALEIGEAQRDNGRKLSRETNFKQTKDPIMKSRDKIIGTRRDEIYPTEITNLINNRKK